MIGVCEGLVYGCKAGLDIERVLALISGGAARSHSLEAYGQKMLNQDFEPTFYVEHFMKDLQIALDEAALMNMKLHGLKLVKDFY